MNGLHIYSEIGSQPGFSMSIGVFVSIGLIVPIRLIVSTRALLYVAQYFCPPPVHILSFSYAYPHIMQRLVNGSTDLSMIAERFALTAAYAQLADGSNDLSISTHWSMGQPIDQSS